MLFNKKSLFTEKFQASVVLVMWKQTVKKCGYHESRNKKRIALTDEQQRGFPKGHRNILNFNIKEKPTSIADECHSDS